MLAQPSWPVSYTREANGTSLVIDSIDRRYANVPLLQKPIEPESLERVLVSLLHAPAALQAAEGD